jgi:hypothetical protein
MEGEPSSPTDPESLDEGPIPRRILFPEILQKPAALSDQHQQAAAGMMVFFVGAKMAGQAIDPLGEERDLYLRRTGVTFVNAVLLNKRSLLYGVQRHRETPRLKND